MRITIEQIAVVRITVVLIAAVRVTAARKAFVRITVLLVVVVRIVGPRLNPKAIHSKQQTFTAELAAFP